MRSPRQMMDRLREERRVRRDFERLIRAEDFRHLDNDWIGDRERKPPFWRRSWKWWVPRVAIAMVVLIIVTGVAFLYAPLPFDPPPPLQTAFVYDRDGNLIARIRPDEDRVVLPLDKIPERVRQAVIASEDERFYQHGGVDFTAILRAAWNDVRGRPLQGGSTITQQLVREVYLSPERTIARKLREAALAIRLERKFSKDEILEQYLNAIYLGDQAYGVEAAAQRYFGKSITNVTLSEAALLASIAPAPARFNPRLDPANAKARRDRVLDRMVENGFVTPQRARVAKSQPIRLVAPKPPPSEAPVFVQYVRDAIIEEHGQEAIDKTGLRVTTTLDLDLQRAAQGAIDGVLTEPDDPSAALVAMDVRTGGILAMAQRGAEFFNLSVQGKRQSGSAFKPFVLATALDEGISKYEYYPAPSEIQIGDWNPHNYDGRSYGGLSVHRATVYSVNTVYAQLIMDVGPEKVARMANRMGIVTELPTDDPTLTLGTPSVSPLEMTTAYATLAARGIRRYPTGVVKAVDGQGELVEGIETNGRRVMGEDLAGEVTEILQDVMRDGTGTGARLSGYDAAGKTGTTNSHRDAWFCGYTTEIAACVWMGYRGESKPMENVHGIRVTGGSFPAQIWNRFMEAAPLPQTELEGGELVVPSDDDGGYVPLPSPAGDDGGPGGGPTEPPEPPPTTEPPTSPSPPQDDCGILPFC